MGLTLLQIKTATGLSNYKIRKLVKSPFPAAFTTLKQHKAGRPDLVYSFADVAPRLHALGVHPDIIAELAATSTKEYSI
jgi:hypothetical protein